jgi:hypothetical protein
LHPGRQTAAKKITAAERREESGFMTPPVGENSRFPASLHAKGSLLSIPAERVGPFPSREDREDPRRRGEQGIL